VQRNKGLSKNRFKIEIPIKILELATLKFNVKKKTMGLGEMFLFSCDLEKILVHCDMADSPKSACSRKCVI